ncbi:hypothetical protein JTB14_012364 [Gonioctena quinquepunctata]|nr:hypothetical protein JTB14_012364 [Gonioctena quinquepunctata]
MICNYNAQKEILGCDGVLRSRRWKELVKTTREKPRSLLSVSTNGREQIKNSLLPSNIGIYGNEQVDRVAQDTTNEPTAPELEGVSHNDLKIHMKSVIHNYWLSKWRNSRTKLKEIRNDIKPWRNNEITSCERTSHDFRNLVRVSECGKKEFLCYENNDIFQECPRSLKAAQWKFLDSVNHMPIN